MTDEADLLRAVIENPDDDTPRLIYADWLDDNGDSVRAEFIRVQIERWNRFGDDVQLADTDYLKLAAREKAIFYANHERWMLPLRQKGEPFQSRDTHGIYRRGFIHEVWMRAKTFLSRGEKLFRQVPVHKLKLTMATEEEFQRFVAKPLVSQIRCLDLRSISWSHRIFASFFESENLRHVARIELESDRWTIRDAQHFSETGPDWRKTEIVFFSSRYDDDNAIRDWHPQIIQKIRLRTRKLTVFRTHPMSIAPTES